ncbi:MAG TPA: hypothetical protein DEV93_14855 [Chloroflexi bacterium]|nr:hypothetical protein [Chloroflexota bacterium]
MPQRASLPPEFLVDRSLGAKVAADIRGAGYRVHTLESVYGRKQAMLVKDVTWLTHTAHSGWLILTKDKRIRRKQLEREAIITAKAKVFCLTKGNLRGVEQQRVVMGCLDEIVKAGEQPGPFVYIVARRGITRLW